MPHPARKHHEYSELPLAANDNYLSSALDKYLGYDDMLAGGGSGSEAWDLIYGGASGVIHFAAKTTEGVVKFPLGMDLAAEGIYSLYKDPSLYLSDINNCSGYLQCANAYTETTLNTASILYGGYQIGKAGISFTASALKSDTVNLNTYNQNIFHSYEPEADWASFTNGALDYKPTSGVVLEASPLKTTTILGSYVNDTRFIIEELGNVKSTDFGPRIGGYNVLNVPDNLYVAPKQFWNEYNKPWLDAAIARGDSILLATKPSFDTFKINSETSVLLSKYPLIDKYELSGFGREYLALKKAGYVYKDGKMVKAGGN